MVFGLSMACDPEWIMNLLTAGLNKSSNISGHDFHHEQTSWDAVGTHLAILYAEPLLVR